jgi:hypothetical protein
MDPWRPVRPGVIPIVAVPARRRRAPLYVSETKIQPRSVHGWFATWRWTLVWFTQLLFYGLPWLTWNGRPRCCSTSRRAASTSSAWSCIRRT